MVKTYQARWTLSNMNHQRGTGFADHKILTIKAESPKLALDAATAEWAAKGEVFLVDDIIHIFDNPSCGGHPLFTRFTRPDKARR